VRIEHAHVHTGINVCDVLNRGLTAIFGRVLDFNGAGLSHNVVLAAVLVTERVSANDNWLLPSWHAKWDVFHQNGLSEDSAVENVADCAIWTPPHLLQVELLNTALVWRDSSAFDGDLVFFGGLGSVNGDLVIGFVAGSDGQVVVLSFHVNVGVDVLLLDPLPNHARHLVAVHVDHLVRNLHLAERGEVSLLKSSAKHVFSNNVRF